MTRAIVEKTAFRSECAVAANIRAPARKVWALLTDARRLPEWNSTVLSFEGSIAKGARIKLRSSSDPKRTFELKVSEFTPPSKMVWENGNLLFRGVRTFSISERSDGTTDFSMREVLSGMMLPMIRPSLPDFRPTFNRFAEDLKTAAEAK